MLKSLRIEFKERHRGSQVAGGKRRDEGVTRYSCLSPDMVNRDEAIVLFWTSYAIPQCSRLCPIMLLIYIAHLSIASVCQWEAHKFSVFYF